MNQSIFSSFRFPPVARGPIEIVFGMPSEDCEKYGLCRIEFNDTPVHARCRTCEQRVPAFLNYVDRDETLEVAIPLEFITSAIWERQFSRGFFELVEPGPIAMEVAQYLGINAETVVKTGRYAYGYAEGYLCLRLQLLPEREANIIADDQRFPGYPVRPDTLDTPLKKYAR